MYGIIYITQIRPLAKGKLMSEDTTTEFDDLEKLLVAAIATDEISNDAFYSLFLETTITCEEELDRVFGIAYNYRPTVYVKLVVAMKGSTPPMIRSSEVQELLKTAEGCLYEYLSLIEALQNSGRLTAKAQAYLDYLECEEQI